MASLSSRVIHEIDRWIDEKKIRHRVVVLGSGKIVSQWQLIDILEAKPDSWCSETNLTIAIGDRIVSLKEAAQRIDELRDNREPAGREKEGARPDDSSYYD